MDLRHRVLYCGRWWVPVSLLPRRHRGKWGPVHHYDDAGLDLETRARERCRCA
jgi:hypothetical protein